MQIEKLLEHKPYLFWALQLAGWGSWGVTFYLGMIVWGKHLSTYALYLPIVSCLGMALTLLTRMLYRATWEMAISKRVIAVLAGSFLAGAAWMLFRNITFNQLFPEEMTNKVTYATSHMGNWSFLEGTASAFMVMVVWSALYFSIKYYLMAQEEQRRRLTATAMAHEAQLKMLHYQLNPHFLFNTLNAISTLILDKDTQLANTMVTRLSRFLRFSLDNDPLQKVTVTEEMEALQLYLEIEKVRFDDRLRLNFHTDPLATPALMPSLLLQPLVENAIKYAISQTLNGGTISISATVDNSNLILSVSDDGPGLENVNHFQPRDGSVGLSNCRQRLKEIYGTNQSFLLSNTDPHGLTITMSIPLEKAE